MFLSAVALPSIRPNPFYDTVNQVLASHQFDPFVEQLCAKFFKQNVGRPGLAPGLYFRCLLIGYFEGSTPNAASPAAALTANRWECFSVTRWISGRQTIPRSRGHAG